MLKNLFFNIAILIFIPFFAKGAVLYFEPASGQYHQGEIFSLKVLIDTEGECINTVKVEIEFSKDVLEVVNFTTGDSILNIWLQFPKIEEINEKLGKISFIGGVPGGYCGSLPGEPGKIGVLVNIFFKVKELNSTFTGKISFSKNSQVLLNDGLGTKTNLSFQDFNFAFYSRETEGSKEEWRKEIAKDKIPPEPFKISIHKNPLIFEGKYFIVFLTTDKQTGIDYYEVQEGKKEWKRAESPYLLEEQSLKSIIKVKAVDKAGNERIVEWVPSEELFIWWTIPLILIVVGVIWLVIKIDKIKSVFKI